MNEFCPSLIGAGYVVGSSGFWERGAAKVSHPHGRNGKVLVGDSRRGYRGDPDWPDCGTTSPASYQTLKPLGNEVEAAVDFLCRVPAVSHKRTPRTPVV